MASDFKISTPARNAACNALVDRLDNGTIAIRTGTPPANVSDASSGTLLGTLGFGSPAFDDAGSAGGNPDGQAAANAISSDADADASGDAGYFRCYPNGAGDTAADWQGTAGEAADTPDMTFDNKTIVAGGTIAVSSFVLSVPIQ